MLDDELLTTYNSLRNEWDSTFKSWYGKSKEIIMSAGQNLESRGHPKEDICQKLLEDFEGLSKTVLYRHAPQEWKRSYTKDESPDRDFTNRLWVPALLKFPALAFKEYTLLAKLVEGALADERIVDALDKRFRDTIFVRELERRAKEWEESLERVRELIDHRQKVEALQLLDIIRRSRSESVRFLAKEYHVSAKRVALLIKESKETA